eukprot:3301230-Rhodomonas_salina.2
MAGQILLWILAVVAVLRAGPADCVKSAQVPPVKRNSMQGPVERFAASVVASSLAESFTLPADVAKVRLQLQNTQVAAKSARYNGMLHCMYTTAKEEGIGALFKGLNPALIRQVSYTGISMMLYEPVRNAIVPKDGEATFVHRLLAGGIAGGIGIAIMNPTEVVKTQIQSSKEGILTMSQVVSRVWATDGLAGFWAGVAPNVARTFLVQAAELGTYDHVKNFFVSQKVLPDGPLAHLASSGVAGFVSALTSTPADVIKTRLMNQAGRAHNYNGIWHALSSTVREEGFTALYKGFVPVFWRKLFWCSIFFVTYEQVRAAVNPAQHGKEEL